MIKVKCGSCDGFGDNCQTCDGKGWVEVEKLGYENASST